MNPHSWTNASLTAASSRFIKLDDSNFINLNNVLSVHVAIDKTTSTMTANVVFVGGVVASYDVDGMLWGIGDLAQALTGGDP